MRLPQMVEARREQLAAIVGQARRWRTELKVAREAAESDEINLDKVEALILNCLVHAGSPGITLDGRVEIPKSSFFPELYGPDPDDVAATTFGTLSSGGKKTLFDCCFAIAVHRPAVQLGAPLPEFLIIDSPMRNTSERENRDQFEGFCRLLYELKENELPATQLVLIDKEFSAPEPKHRFTHVERHMRPDDRANAPSVPCHEGKQRVVLSTCRREKAREAVSSANEQIGSVVRAGQAKQDTA